MSATAKPSRGRKPSTTEATKQPSPKPFIPDRTLPGPVTQLDTGEKTPEEIQAMIEQMAQRKPSEMDRVKGFLGNSSLEGLYSSRKGGSRW
jgi:hypothetical protein